MVAVGVDVGINTNVLVGDKGTVEVGVGVRKKVGVRVMVGEVVGVPVGVSGVGEGVMKDGRVGKKLVGEAARVSVGVEVGVGVGREAWYRAILTIKYPIQ